MRVQQPEGTTVAGLVLAAGAGRRMGGPKALVRGPNGVPWVRTRAETLAAGGCDRVLVALGAQAAMARAALPDDVGTVVVTGWEGGMGVSLSAGLAACGAIRPAVHAVLVALVDTPGLTAEAVSRVVRAAVTGEVPLSNALVQAAYDGAPGHPVLLGRDHWDGVRTVAVGDSGARAYLRGRDVLLVECGDVADGADVDTPEQLPG